MRLLCEVTQNMKAELPNSPGLVQVMSLLEWARTHLYILCVQLKCPSFGTRLECPFFGTNFLSFRAFLPSFSGIPSCLFVLVNFFHHCLWSIMSRMGDKHYSVHTSVGGCKDDRLAGCRPGRDSECVFQKIILCMSLLPQLLLVHAMWGSGPAQVSLVNPLWP